MKLKEKFRNNRLWAKAFCIVIISSVCLMTIFVVMWEKKTIHYAFEKEERKVLENQAYISNVLTNVVSFTALSEGVEKLSEEQLQKAVKSAFYYNMGSLSLYKDGRVICATEEIDVQRDLLLLQQDIKEGSCYVDYSRTDNIRYVKVVSELMLQDEVYRLITTTDISELYEYEQNMIRHMTINYMISGLCMAAVLLIVFWHTFKPLKKINDQVTNIASGNYNNRLEIKEGNELGELSSNINHLAKAVGDYVHYLKESANQQDRFVQNLSHEMKTPLTSIICYAELMQFGKKLSREKRKSYADILLFESSRLKNIAETLKEFLSIGQISEEHKRWVWIRDHLNKILGIMEPLFEKKEIHLVTEIEDFGMVMDPDLFETMLYNYLENAIKASETGGTIELRAYSDKQWKVIEIQDHGIGVKEEELLKIEEPFYMVDKARTRKAGGAGLGMTLCKKIVQAHHGVVTIQSQWTKGTTITLQFPDTEEKEKT